MKEKFKFLIMGLAGVLLVGVSVFGIANASNSLIYVSPNNLDKQVGENFVLAVMVDTAGSKVCAVEGELRLDKLSCQNIVLGEGLAVQKMPSCSDLSFLIGIKKCATENKTLFTIAVRADQAGTATASFADVDVMGEGFSLSKTSVNGNYNLTAAAPITPVKKATPVPVVVPVGPTENCVCEDWGEWQRIDCGAGECEATQLSQSRARNCEPSNCEVTVENRCVADAYCAAAISTQTASIGDAFRFGDGGFAWLTISGLILLLLIIFIPYYLKKKKK